MTPPDSGGREVCGSVIANVNGAFLCCDMKQGHKGAHTAKLTGWLSAHGIATIPLPLAQRILAALEDSLYGRPIGFPRAEALRDELRAAVERKP